MHKPVYIHLSNDFSSYGGRSRWFGFPIMPKNYPLPLTEDGYCLPFICQIDCREIPAGDFPKDGVLYFFADVEYYCGYEGEPMPMYSGDDYVRVIYIPEEELVDLAERDDDCVPDVFPAERITLNFNPPEGDEPEHRLAGESDQRQWEDWDPPYEGWKLLFQMDSCDGDGYCYNFQDWGVLNILISPSALRRRDFSHCVGIILST